jgi:hypothetical protein
LTGCLSRLPCHKFTEIFGQNYTASQTFFFLWKKKKIKYNFNTATHGGLKKQNIFNRVAQLLASKGSKSTFWAISPVSSVAISLKKKLPPPWVISNVCYYWCTVVRWWEIFLFFSKMTFLTLDLDATPPKISLEKFFFRISSTQCTVYFLAHFCPVAFFRQMIALKITLKKTHF